VLKTLGATRVRMSDFSVEFSVLGLLAGRSASSLQPAHARASAPARSGIHIAWASVDSTRGTAVLATHGWIASYRFSD